MTVNTIYDAKNFSEPQNSFTLVFGQGNRDQANMIRSVMQNELVIGGGNSFTSTGALLRDMPIAGNIYKFKDEWTQTAKQMGGYNKFTSTETIVKWEESNKPSFTCDFTLLAQSANEAEVNMGKIKLLQSAVLPVGTGGSLKGPLGYTGRNLEDTKGTLKLLIGTWFVADYLIMVSSSATPSRQVMSNGLPVSWKCSFTVEPISLITIEEFQSYFQTPTVVSSTQGATAGPNVKNDGLYANWKKVINEYGA